MTEAINLIENNRNGMDRARVSSTRFGNGLALGVLQVPEARVGQYEVRNAMDKEYVYQQLFHLGRKVADNDPAGLGKHKEFLVQAHGSVLVSGVGLGGFLYRALRKSNVWHITVVEPSLHIINILEKSFSQYADKLTFVNCKGSDIVNSHVYDIVYLNE